MGKSTIITISMAIFNSYVCLTFRYINIFNFGLPNVDLCHPTSGSLSFACCSVQHRAVSGDEPDQDEILYFCNKHIYMIDVSKTDAFPTFSPNKIEMLDMFHQKTHSFPTCLPSKPSISTFLPHFTMISPCFSSKKGGPQPPRPQGPPWPGLVHAAQHPMRQGLEPEAPHRRVPVEAQGGHVVHLFKAKKGSGWRNIPFIFPLLLVYTLLTTINHY